MRSVCEQGSNEAIIVALHGSGTSREMEVICSWNTGCVQRGEMNGLAEEGSDGERDRNQRSC